MLPSALRPWLLALTLVSAGAAHAERFTIVALPDTQNYSKDFPAIYDAQMQWIVDNAEAENIVFVTHLGDIVNNADELQQWLNARGSHDILDAAGIPNGTAMGNHDNNGTLAPTLPDTSCLAAGGNDPGRDCAGSAYLTYFSPSRYDSEPWWGGSSPSGLSNYQLLELGAFRFLFLHLEVDPRLAEREWAQGVLDAHPNHLVLLTTHRYMYDYRVPASSPRLPQIPPVLSLIAGGRFTAVVHGLGQPLYYQSSIPADELFANFIAANQNIILVHCGHVDAELRQTSTNDAGLDVREILADFQSFSPNGGDGWLRLVTFDINDRSGVGSISVETYSPTRDEFRENGDGLSGSIQALNEGFTEFQDDLDAFFSPAQIQQIQDALAFWATPGAGQDEFSDLLYSSGARDSHFRYEDVDFTTYVPEPSGGWLALTGLGSVSALLRARRGRRA